MTKIAEYLNLFNKEAKEPAVSPEEETNELPVHTPYQRSKFFSDHIFIHTHVPKAGGTTLTNGLASIVGWGLP